MAREMIWKGLVCSVVMTVMYVCVCVGDDGNDNLGKGATTGTRRARLGSMNSKAKPVTKAG